MRYPEMQYLSFLKSSVFFIVFFTAGFITPAFAADYNMAWPEKILDKKQTDNDLSKASGLKSYEKRYGVINVASGILDFDSPVVKGDTVTLSFFADAVYRIKIDTVRHYPDGTTVFTGKSTGNEMIFFTMTADSTNFIMTLNDVQKNMTYRATGKMSGSQGNVKELDIKEMPPVKHLPPIKPENASSTSYMKK